MSYKYNVYWNEIELFFTSPNEEEGDINEDFDYEKKLFTITLWVQSLINIDEEYELKSQVLYYSIIKKLRDKAEEKRLDYLQKLKINNTNCWIIDNGANICLLLPSEY